MTDLIYQQCQRKVKLLDENETEKLLSEIHVDWSIANDNKSIRRSFTLSNYYETLAFINAAAQIAHKQDHHPDISFGYKQCDITYSTHSVGGLSLNDFICAAKIDLIYTL